MARQVSVFWVLVSGMLAVFGFAGMTESHEPFEFILSLGSLAVGLLGLYLCFPPARDGLRQELRSLECLRRDGLISEEEATERRQRLLGSA